MKIYAHKWVKEIQKLCEEIIGQTNSETTVEKQLEMIAKRFVTEFEKGNDAVTTVISNWHRNFIGKDHTAIVNSNFTEADSKLPIAKEHGFQDWNEVESRVETRVSIDFENAIDTLLSGDIESLRAQITANPKLLKERSKYGHRASLLHYVSGNGVETRRQFVPLNLPEIARFLIEKGADRDAKMRVYGGEFTALRLAATSAHPKEAGILDDLIKVLETT